MNCLLVSCNANKVSLVAGSRRTCVWRNNCCDLVNMSKVEILRVFVNQRLTAAAEEIFELFERTIGEYKKQLMISSTENQHQQKLLDAVLNPEVRIHRADNQQLFVVKEDVPPEQQDWSPSLDQDNLEPLHIKEEQEELWISQEGEQRQGLEEADVKFPLTSVPVNSVEDDQEKAQSSQLHERQTEENREEQHLETEADGEDCGGSESDRNSDPDSPLLPDTHDKTSPSSEPETDDSRHWMETNEPQSGSNSSLVSNTRDHSDGKPFSCPFCKTGFRCSTHLDRHMRSHTGEKPFSCSYCGKTFKQKEHLNGHLFGHTGEKPFSCSLCGKRFAYKGDMRRHLTVHTGEKPFSCSICGKSFAQRQHLKRHLLVHTGEKPFSCSVCDKSFTRLHNAKKHKCVSEISRKT